MKNFTFLLLVILITLNFNAKAQYCPTTTNSPGTMGINEVSINTMFNTTMNSVGYSDFSAMSTDVERGLTYSLNVVGYGSFNQYVRTWIDYNDDGDFDDAGELLYTAFITGPSYSYNYSLLIPNDATFGKLRVRVATESEMIGLPNSCGTFEYGEVEDYSINVLSNCTMTASVVSQTNVTCFGGNDGEVTVTGVDGISPYTFEWSNTSTDATISNLVAGTYDVTVKDANTCTATASVEIKEPISTISTSSIDFGFVDKNTTSAEMSFDISGTDLTASSGDITVTPPANFEVSLTSSSGFTSSPLNISYTSGTLANTTVYVRFKPTARIAYNSNISISGGCSEAKNIAVTGNAILLYCPTTTNNSGTMGIGQVSLNTMFNTTMNSVGYSDFSAMSTDVQRGLTYSLNVVGYGSFNQYVRTWIDYNDDGDFDDAGELLYTVFITSPSYSYNYSLLIPNDATFGKLRVRVATESEMIGLPNSCGVFEYGEVEDYSINVIDPCVGFSASIDSKTDVLCKGSNTGSATATQIGGTSPYNYTWTGGGSSSTYSNLIAGTYTVTVKDFNNCEATTSIEILEPVTAISLSAGATNPTCNTGTGTITANASGGTGTILFSINGVDFQASNVFSGLADGTYTITAKDDNACTKTTTATVAIPSALTSTDVQVACGSFDWIDGNTYTSNNNTATWTIPSHFGCDSTITLDLTINALPTITSQSGNVTSCGDMSADFSVSCSGNNTYQWYYDYTPAPDGPYLIDGTYTEINYNTDNMTIQSLLNGDYNDYYVFCEITDQLTGCKVFSNNDSIVVYTIPVTPTISFDGTTLSSDAVSGNQWYKNGILVPDSTFQDFVPVETGDYTVVVTSVDGCESGVSNSINVLITKIDKISTSEISIFPNPTTGILNVKFENISENSKISIIDLNGKSIIEEEISANTSFTKFDLSRYSKGVYFLKIQTNTEINIHKIVIE